MMDRTWYDPLGDHAAKWNVKPKDSHTKLCPHILVQPVRKDSGHFLDMRRDTKIRPCSGRISTIAQYDAEPPGEGPRQFRVHADGEGLLQRIDTFLDIKP